MASSRAAPGASFSAAFHPEKPSAVARTTTGRSYTTSIAIPGSIVTNAQTPELRGWLAGQIARTCAIFSVSEIVVYKDTVAERQTFKPRGKYREIEGEGKEEEDPSVFLARILEYLETPQLVGLPSPSLSLLFQSSSFHPPLSRYLRKALFPLHPSLRLAGLLPPLDCPHHLRRDDDSPFREGVVVSTSPEIHHQNKKRRTDGGAGATGRVMVDVGQWDPIEASGGEGVGEGMRVTIRMPTKSTPLASLVPPSTPTLESGLYWGYQVRVADSLSCVFSECPFESDGGYDISIGTSERGTPIENILDELPPFRHLILTLGPLSGLELTIASDPLIPLEAEEASDLFDHWINVVEGQGSRTVRTELKRDSTSVVYATARDVAKADSLKALGKEYTGRLVPVAVDMLDEATISAAVTEIKKHTTTLDTIIINAGILLGEGKIQDLSAKDLLENLNGNIVGPHNITKAFSPLLIKNQAEKKTLVYISSFVGSIAALPQVTLSGLNMLARQWAESLEQDGVAVLLVHPGAVATDLNSGDDLITVEESAKGVWNVVVKAGVEDGQKGIHSYDGSVAPW
ncbi:methyltransferase, partial [Phenoliferia sp. Uapishka_3]